MVHNPNSVASEECVGLGKTRTRDSGWVHHAPCTMVEAELVFLCVGFVAECVECWVFLSPPFSLLARTGFNSWRWTDEFVQTLSSTVRLPQKWIFFVLIPVTQYVHLARSSSFPCLPLNFQPQVYWYIILRSQKREELKRRGEFLTSINVADC